MEEWEHLDAEYAINPEMIWGCRINDDEVRIYICEDKTFIFSQEAVRALHEVLSKFV